MNNYLVDLHRLRHNPYNGLYVFCKELANQLPGHLLADERLHYYVPEDKIGTFGNKVSYVKHKRIHKYYQTGTSNYDVWHLTSGISQYRPFNKKTKVVYTIHDVNFLVEDPDNKKRNSRSLKLMQKNADQADHIVGISEYALEFAGQHLNFGNKPRSIIYNGYDVKEFPGFNSPNYRPARPFLFTISLVQPRKNFHVLPALLVNNDFELIIAGLNHFDYAKTIVEEAKKMGVEDRVKLIGPVTDEEKYWYNLNAEAFLFPSVAEGFGMPALEAMHFGKPVFLSKFMSLPEVGGKAAYYFEDFSPESMRQSFSDGMNDYSQNDRKDAIISHAHSFSWSKAAAEYMNVYRSLI